MTESPVVALSCVPLMGTDTRLLLGVQLVAPRHVSRTNASPTPPGSPLTMFAELELKATNLASALMDGFAPLAALPSDATEMSVVLGLQPDGTPIQVSRRNTQFWNVLLLAQAFVPGSRFVA